MKCKCGNENLKIPENGFSSQPEYILYKGGKPICGSCLDKHEWVKVKLVIK